ncbi:ThiF family adenylyltransferase [Gordonia sp. ABKF26]|uniref:ThiF family adenylyltransferase n=1 Tax=Gordonia sp. ABKF26 TaxID=3238687 RepID=UPI0034E3DCC2
MTRSPRSAWQRTVLSDLAAIAHAFPDEVVVVGRPRSVADGGLQVKVRLRTAEIAAAEGGVRLRTYEEFVMTVGLSSLVPPSVDVEHSRFLHHAHVLCGYRLCLYLDPAREWDPAQGIGGLLDRLVGWLRDAAGARFDARTALYHAVGGVLHVGAEVPTIVVRQSVSSSRRASHAWLVRRASRRYDLTLTRPLDQTAADHLPLITFDTDLPYGAGDTLAQLLYVMDHPYLPNLATPLIRPGRAKGTDQARMFLTAVAASALRKPQGSPQGFVAAVPHPAGGPVHLLAARISASVTDQLRSLAAASRKKSAMIDIQASDLDTDAAVEWWRISDERAEVTTRRDAQRPVTGFAGKTVLIWGCGGLGSWIAEYVMRAGPATLLLCDPATISGGLLVRQNYVEDDIGETKARALIRRLRSVNEAPEVEEYPANGSGARELNAIDVIIDATISIGVGRGLDDLCKGSHRPTVASVATDLQTGTLGVMTVSMPPSPMGPLSIDRIAGQHVLVDSSREAFHGLWAAPRGSADELIPTRGCSVPTFHGSAADLAGVAASLTSILGAHLKSPTAMSGTHLISLPHGEAGPLRDYVPAG